MWPSAHLPGLDVAIVPYDVMRVTAQVGCIALAAMLNRQRGIAPATTIAIALLAVIPGIWGARLLDIAEYRGAYPSLEAALGRSGSSIYGGILGGLAVVAIASSVIGVRLLPFLDGAGAAIALGEAITRLGCFAAGCCYGAPWDGPWAVRFPRESAAFGDLVQRGLLDANASSTLPLHPVQLYGTGLMLACAVWLVRRHAGRAPDGEIFGAFLVLYGAERLAVSPFRMEQLASMKALSVLFIVSGMLVTTWSRRRCWAPGVARAKGAA